jgi:hypothetical protein
VFGACFDVITVGSFELLLSCYLCAWFLCVVKIVRYEMCGFSLPRGVESLALWRPHFFPNNLSFTLVRY